MKTLLVHARAFVALALLVGCDASKAPSVDASTDARDRDANEMRDSGGAQDGGRDASDVIDAGPDADVIDASDAGSDAGDVEPLEWESVEVTTNDGQIIIEKVSYRSEGLLIWGQVCRPVGAGPFPVHVINHGGFSGISVWNGGTCANAARSGWVVAESSYRGEDSSEGSIEVCLGEVTDVLRMTDIVLAQAYSDDAHVLMSGGSHGGCITLRAVQRGAPVQAAVDIFGPTDWSDAHAMWRSALNAGSPLSANYTLLINQLEASTGGTPEQVPDAYRARSPIAFTDALRDHPARVLVLHGTTDAYVPVVESCAYAELSADFQVLHVTTAGVASTSTPAGCESTSLTWPDGTRPTTDWPRRSALIYDDVGHGFEGAGGPHLIADYTAFATALLNM